MSAGSGPIGDRFERKIRAAVSGCPQQIADFRAAAETASVGEASWTPPLIFNYKPWKSSQFPRKRSTA